MYKTTLKKTSFQVINFLPSLATEASGNFYRILCQYCIKTMFQVTEGIFIAWNVIRNYYYGLTFLHKIKATSQRNNRETDGERQDAGDNNSPVLLTKWNQLYCRGGEHNGRNNDSSTKSNSGNVVAKLKNYAVVGNLHQITNSIDGSHLWNNKSVPGRWKPKVIIALV